MSKRKPIKLETSGRTQLCKVTHPTIGAQQNPGAVVYTGAGILLVLVRGPQEIRVRNLRQGDESYIGGNEILTSQPLEVNGVKYTGWITLRPQNWVPKYPCSLGLQRKEITGWILRRHNSFMFRKTGYSAWQAKSKASPSALGLMRDLCEDAAKHVLSLFPGLLDTAELTALQSTVNRLAGDIDQAYVKIDSLHEHIEDLNDEYADAQEKLGTKQANRRLN